MQLILKDTQIVLGETKEPLLESISVGKRTCPMPALPGNDLNVRGKIEGMRV